MAKKVFLNVLYNLAILILLFCLFWGSKNEYYFLSVVTLFPLVLIVYLKVRLIKEVRQAGRKSK